MQILPSKLSTFLLAFSLASVSSSHALSTVPMTAQEKLAADILHARGLTRVMILNEKKGHLLIVENGQILKAMSAITGKTIGDRIDSKADVTPAGMFPLLPSPVLAHPDASISYYNNPETKEAYTFHRVIAGREKALAGKIAADKRISNGCVNLFDADFNAVANYTMTTAKTVVFADGQKGHRASWVFILPESSDLKKTRNALKAANDYKFE